MILRNIVRRNFFNFQSLSEYGDVFTSFVNYVVALRHKSDHLSRIMSKTIFGKAAPMLSLSKALKFQRVTGSISSSTSTPNRQHHDQHLSQSLSGPKSTYPNHHRLYLACSQPSTRLRRTKMSITFLSSAQGFDILQNGTGTPGLPLSHAPI